MTNKNTNNANAMSSGLLRTRANQSIGFAPTRSQGCAAQLSCQVAELGAVPFWRQVLARSQASAVQALGSRHTLAITPNCGLAIYMPSTA